MKNIFNIIQAGLFIIVTFCGFSFKPKELTLLDLNGGCITSGNQQITANSLPDTISAAQYGIQIIRDLKAAGFGIELQQQTKDAIRDVLKKYLAEGGKLNFTVINEELN